MAKLFANSGDPDQTPHSAASDLGLHCLPITLLRVSRLQWVKTAQENKSRDILGKLFYSSENVCWVYSIELPHPGDSNEYTKYIIIED